MDKSFCAMINTVLFVILQTTMFWNLENFFDCFADSTGYDAVWTPKGERHWTYKRFKKKCSDIAKGILWCAGNCGGLPDVIGFAEVENRFVLKCLLKYTILEKLDYQIVHFDSPDRGGIDVALMYRKSRLKLLQARPVPVTAAHGGDTLRTRDILVADFVSVHDPPDSFTVAVNHHPSKFGGGDSDWRRQAALDALADALPKPSAHRTVVACGDFNDVADAQVYADFCARTGLVSLAAPLARQGLGTIRYEGRWELIDHIYINREASARMKILKIPFLMTRDNTHAGEKPLRTYVGPRYAGGVSDHLPVLLLMGKE